MTSKGGVGLIAWIKSRIGRVERKWLPSVTGLAAVRVARQERRHAFPIVLDSNHATIEMDGPTLCANPIASHFPHLTRSESRIVKLIDQGFDNLASTTTQLAKQGRSDGSDQTQILDSLSRPFGRDAWRSDTPHTFSVYDLKKISNSSLPNRLTTQSSTLRSGLIGSSRAWM